MRKLDPIGLLAAANPRPTTDPTAVANVAARDAIRATIDRRRTQSSRRDLLPSLWKRPAIVVAAVAVVLAVPALAFSGVFDSLFGFSNQGTGVSTSQLDLNSVQILEKDKVDIGAGITLLATRDNIAIYVSRTTDGNTCLLTGPAGGTAPTAITIGTLCESDFPSPQHPLLGNYVLAKHAYEPLSTVVGLEGLAADGVATVEAINSHGTVILQAPVIDNVYYAPVTTPNFPITVAATEIVALDANGNVIYTEPIPQPAWAKAHSSK